MSLETDDQSFNIRNNRTLDAPSHRRNTVDTKERRSAKRTKTLGSPEVGGVGSKEFIQDMRAARESVANKKTKRHSAREMIPRADRKAAAVEKKSESTSSVEIQVTPAEVFVCSSFLLFFLTAFDFIRIISFFALFLSLFFIGFLIVLEESKSFLRKI